MDQFKVREKFISYNVPDLTEKEVEAVDGTIRSHWVAKGPRTAKFEEEFAKRVGAKHAVAMNSCTAALHVALLSNDIGPGDEVITTPMTF